ncbi:hypothetical protein KBX50_03735 [Micromonospora sp. C51]|nr:hypothetical protein [Micromonospora sp. C51]
MEIAKVYFIRNRDSGNLDAKLEIKDDPAAVEVETLEPEEWRPVGEGASRGDAVLLELRFPASAA